MLKLHTKKFDAKSEDIANATKGDFTYAFGDIPVINLEDRPIFSPAKLTKKQFEKLEKELLNIREAGPGYSVFAQFSDQSGYVYWKKQDGEYLDILITTTILDISAIDAIKLADAFETATESVYRIFDSLNITFAVL